MNLRKELKEDARFELEFWLGDAGREYTYPGNSGPVIAVSGIGGGWPKNGLRKIMSGYRISGKLIYRNFFRNTLHYYLEDLANVIREYDRPILMGYSAGGLLLIAAVQKFNLWNHIQKIITVAAPFDGIRPSILGHFLNSVKDVEQGSEFVKTVRDIEVPKGKVISIFAKHDRFIPKPENIELAWPKIITEAKSHGDLQNHAEWLESILQKELKI